MNTDAATFLPASNPQPVSLRPSKFAGQVGEPPGWRPEVVLVTDEWPVKGRTGQQSYLRAIVDWLEARQLQTLVIVTGAKTDWFRIGDEQIGATNTVRFVSLRDRHIAGGFVPFNTRTLAKLIYRRLHANRFLRPLLRAPRRRFIDESTSRASVIINRWISSGEVASIKSMVLQRGLQPRIVMIDTLFKSDALNAFSSSPAKVLIAHDVFSERCESFMKQGMRPWPIVSRDQEKQQIGIFECVLAISEPDADAFKAMRTRATVYAIPAVSASGGVSDNPEHRLPEAALLFMGSRGTHNVHGLNWFLSKIWPGVLATVPHARLDVVGTVCGEIETGHPNVMLHGRLDDPSAVAARCTAAINPILAGSGMKVKALDYAAFALPILSTTVGAAGLESFIEAGSMIVADDPSEAVSQAILLLQNGRSAKDRGRIAAECLANHFSFSVMCSRLDNAIAPLLAD